MKKILVLLMSLILVAGFASCDDSGDIAVTTGTVEVNTDVTDEETLSDNVAETEVPASSASETEEMTEGSGNAGDDVIISDDNSDDIVGKWQMSIDFDSVVGTAPEGFSSDAAVVMDVEFKADGTTSTVIEVKSFMESFEEYWADCVEYLKKDNYKMLLELTDYDSLDELQDEYEMSVDEVIDNTKEGVMAIAVETLDSLGKADSTGKIVSEEKFILTGNKLYMNDEIDSDYLAEDNYYILDMEDDSTYVAYAYDGDDEYKAFTMKKVG